MLIDEELVVLAQSFFKFQVESNLSRDVERFAKERRANFAKTNANYLASFESNSSNNNNNKASNERNNITDKGVAEDTSSSSKTQEVEQPKKGKTILKIFHILIGSNFHLYYVEVYPTICIISYVINCLVWTKFRFVR